MFKQMVTLFRGAHVEAGEAFTDANAEALLRQQVRDCTQNLEKTRLAVASVMAQSKREQKMLDRLTTQIAELEGRAVAALETGEDALAREAATIIAELESDRDTADGSVKAYEAEVLRMRKALSETESRLSQLNRGQKTAQAHAATQRLRDRRGPIGDNTLQEAESTLSRLQQQQTDSREVEAALQKLNATTSADTVRDKLADAGCGPSIKTNASEVLERLKAKTTVA